MKNLGDKLGLEHTLEVLRWAGFGEIGWLLEGWELDRTVWNEFEEEAVDFTVVSEIDEPVIGWRTDNWVLRDSLDFSNLIIWAFK